MTVRDHTTNELGTKMEHWKSKFPAFPYKPYSIQVDFMYALYQYLDKGGIAMLESPTGTGKTLSIISSALQWLVDRRKQPISTSGDQCCSDNEPDWMRNFVVNKDNPPENKRKTNQGLRLRNKVKGGGGSCLDLTGSNGGSDLGIDSGNMKRRNSTAISPLEENDEEFLLEEYDSEGEEGEGGDKSKRKANRVFDSSSSDDEENAISGEEEKGLKVYFCSRTHSQLSQFVKELKKTDFGSELTVISLGSRKNFCTNEEVLKLGNPTRINERCLELQKSKKDGVSKIKNLRARGGKHRTKVSSGCPMIRKRSLQKEFKDSVSQEEALDIEDLVQLGKNLGTCPYYGSRSMVPLADLIVLPYQSLLSKSSREALGLNLKNNIVIIDEAHNLADSLISMYDSKITLSQLNNLHDCLEKYYARFCNLFGPGNRRYIQTLLLLTQAFLRVVLHGMETSEDVTHSGITKDSEAKIPNEYSMAINDFLFSLNIDNINFVKLIHYVKESNIIHKVSGYGDKAAEKNNKINGEEGSTLSGFQALIDMLLALVNSNADGRIVISRAKSSSSGEQEGSIKYVMLTGEKIFSEIATQAHAVVLTGGTLQPIEETRERLFPWLSPSQLHFFSCSHIVPHESILPIIVPHGPSGMSFDFSYGSRGSPKMIEELGLLLCNLVTVVPEGIVIFFSSFEYEAKVFDAWKGSGILQRIMRKKRLFREPRSNTDVEIVLKDYKETIDKLSHKDPNEGQSPQNGAVLLAVVGGKISEGINFSDGMGRCIVMVGLPYPSPSDIVLVERIKHMEGLGDKDSSLASQAPASCVVTCDAQSGFEILRRCKRRGREYYENLCMKAVNQSIGRAIRHVNDYAAIILADSRYACDPSKGSSSHAVNKLPQWIKDCLVPVPGGYGEVHRQLHQFFRYNKQKHSR